jgi:glutathione S-transferase
MAQFVEVEQAIGMPGLRVVLSPGVPGPWGEAAKGILHIKKIPYTRVRQDIAGENVPLRQWTAQTTAPVFVYNDERPRSIWIDQLYLAERLGPEPPLIPANINDRALMFGLSNEICGESGFGWARRLMMLHATMTAPNVVEAAKERMAFLGNKYGYAPHLAEAAPQRVTEIVKALSDQLDQQRKRDSHFFIGDRLSALDIYWAAFAALIQPLPNEFCAIPDGFRRMYICTHPAVMAAASPHLLAHRDFIYHEYLELPIDLKVEL